MTGSLKLCKVEAVVQSFEFERKHDEGVDCLVGFELTDNFKCTDYGLFAFISNFNQFCNPVCLGRIPHRFDDSFEFPLQDTQPTILS